LFKSLNAMDPNVRDSLDCMTNSGIYTAAQLAQIEQFVQANGGITNQAVDLALADSARKYQTDKIETAVIMDIISILGDTGIQEVIENDYKHPSPIKNYHTQYLLNEVANRIKVLQFGFRKYLSDEFNVSTLSAATKAQIKENMPKSASWQDISKFLDDIGFIARGCGFTIDDERPEVKNSMSVIDAGKNSTGVHMSEWEHLYCPHCHQYVKLIKNGDPTTYFQGSHHCGQLLSCN